MRKYDKIRILWIHDEVRGLPGTNFPKHLSDYFECVIKFKDDVGNYTIAPVGSVSEFNDLFRIFIESKDYSKLPVEILATDYDLSKYDASQLQMNQNCLERNSIELERINALIDHDELGFAEDNPNKSNNTDYDGFLIAGFYLAATRSHPCALVKMTTKQDDLIGTSLSHFENTFTTMFNQNLDFNKARSWDNIILYGTKVLRNQIKILFNKQLLKINFEDIISLFHDPNYEILTITSDFVTRRLPTKGLFLDIPNEKRTEYIREWVDNLISKKKIYTITDINEAKDIARKLIDFYLNCDEELLNERMKLSALSIKDDLSTSENAYLKKLFQKFDIEFDKRGNGNCKKHYEIRNSSGNKSVKRWTLIFVISELISLWIKTNEKLSNISRDKIKEISPICKEDIYLALFLIPKNPLALPWHNYSDRNRYATWDRYLSSLGLKIDDILAGNLYSDEDNILGLTENEVFIIELCYDTEFIKWLEYPSINRIFRGRNESRN